MPLAIEHLPIIHTFLIPLELQELRLMQLLNLEIRLDPVLLKMLHECLRRHSLIN